MKNLVILGASRAGKSTLAYEINKIYPNYQILTGDAIRRAFQDTFPQMEINNHSGKGMKEDFARFSACLFKTHLKDNIGVYQYIFDSCDISVENAIRFFQDETNMIIFLGYSRLTPQEAFQNYRKYEKRTDWTVRKTDEQLLAFAEEWVEKSKVFEEDCKKYHIKYVDTSYHRESVLKSLIEELTEELNG